jgi:hypothetical protein
MLLAVASSAPAASVEGVLKPYRADIDSAVQAIGLLGKLNDRRREFYE